MTLELGGKSPNIILPDADLDAAVKGAYQAIYYNTGQACNAGSRLFVHKDQYDDVLSGLAEAAGKARLGPGLDEGTQMGPLISAEQEERVRGYIESGKSEGAELVTGGNARDGDGYFVEPTLFSATDDDLTIAREEIFGPVLVALPVRHDRGGRPPRERHRVRPGRRRLDARHRGGAQAGGAAARRRHLDQHLERGRPGRAVRRLQGVRGRPRARPRGARGLPREQDRLGEPGLPRCVWRNSSTPTPTARRLRGLPHESESRGCERSSPLESQRPLRLPG